MFRVVYASIFFCSVLLRHCDTVTQGARYPEALQEEWGFQEPQEKKVNQALQV